MKYWMLPAAIAILSVGLAACERETRTVEKSGTTVVQPTVKEKEKTAAALKTMLAAFDRRRKFLHGELNKIPGVTCLLAEGAFYLFPNISSFGLKDLEFCNRLLDSEKVAAVPGSAFGAEGYLRLSYETSDEIIQKGVTRLARFCATLKK